MAKKGTTTEAEVELGVDGAQIKSAFDTIDARIKNIQSLIDTITKRSAEAAKAFGGSLQGEINKVNKMAGQIDGFYKTVERSQRATGKYSDAGVDRNLRTLQLRRELAAETDLKSVEMLREASALHLNGLIANRARLLGAERVAHNALIREEIERNKLIDARMVKLRQEQNLLGQQASAGGKQPGLFGARGLTGVVARTAAYGGAAQLLFGAQNAVMGGAQFAVEWEDALAKLKAIANATEPELAQLKNTIIDVGKESRFSLIDLTEMATKLAQAGVSAGGMRDALRATSTLASASGSTPAEAVDLITASLGSFQLQGKEAARIADVMTSALNRTRLTVQQAALAIQYVGTTAYESNISFEQLLATAGALSQAGIRSGSTIGTGFRQFLVDLQSPTEKLKGQFDRLGISAAEVDVKTRGLPAVLETLQQKGFGASQAYGSLETRAAAFYLVAKNNLPIMADLQMSFADQNAAMIAQERSMNSLAAQWQRFKNVLADQFDGFASGILTGAKNLLQQVSDIMEGMRREAEKARKQREDPNANAFQKDLMPGLADLAEAALNGPNLGFAGATSDRGLGTWLRNLGRDTNDATGKMQELETAVNRTSQAAAEQRDTVSALDKEILRLVTQKEALKGKTQLVTAETVTLMSRFEGLSRNIVGATGDINGLIGAMQKLRDQEAVLLIDRLSEQAGALQAREFDARASRMSAVDKIRNNPAYNQLSAVEKNALSQLGGANGRQAAQTLLDAAKKFQENNIEFGKLLTAAGSNRQAEYSNAGQQGVLRSQIGQFKAGQTEVGKYVSNQLLLATGGLETLRTASGANRTNQANFIEGVLTSTEKKIKGVLSLKLQESSREYLNAALADIESLRNQKRDILNPSKSDLKATADAAQLLSFGSPVAGKPQINSPVGKRQSPGGIGSTNHQGVDIKGKEGDPVFAAADGVVSFAGPRGGYGNMIIIEHGLGTETRYGHLSVIDVVQGQEVAKGQKIGRIGSTGNSTGPHLHFERRINGGKIDTNPLSPTAKGSLADISDKAQQLADKEERRAERNASALSRLKTSTSAQELSQTIEDLKYSMTEAVFDAGVQAVKGSFEQWAQNLREQAESDLDRSDATDAERQDRMREIEAQIKQRREEMEQSIYDAVVGNFTRTMDELQKAFERALVPSQSNLMLAQSRLSGLSRQSMQGKVPDYVQQLAQSRVGAAEEAASNARMEALPGFISQASAELDRLQLKLAMMPQTDAQWENTNRLVQDQRDRIANLTLEYQGLQAAFTAADQIPQTIGEGLTQAIAAYREANNLTASWTEMINMNLGGAIGQLHQSLEGLLMDLSSGTVGVKDAFRNMALSIIKYLQQMLVKMIAVKLMQAALSLIPTGGSSGITASPTSAPSFDSNPILGQLPSFGSGNFHGGEIKGAYRGEYIRDGVANRDSTMRRLAKGEFVTRKKAVDSVGVDFMRSINERGAMALKGVAPKIVMPPPAQQTMSVYVVAPDEKPQMGPNDVLLTIANDVYRGGPTKQLIKQVVQGG